MSLLAFIAAASVWADLSVPPPRYDTGRYTAKIVYVTKPSRRCQQLNGAPSTGTVTIACYAPKIDTVIMPYYCNPRTYKPSTFCRALLRHELGHARGGMHVDGVWVKGYWVKP
ncbi:hypothetical protein [Caulobacter phage KcrB]|nr:hypothetical protein RW_GP080c [Caulobacter phage RW]WCA46384.1 hypothetical protein [Caulobacter phage KcrB]WCD56319.1 hypothetical protein [Caulobacter phage RLK]WNV48111.1 hypothetical protein GB2A_gp079c [Caulobacter phage GB2A]